MARLLTDDEVSRQLEDLPGWTRHGDTIMAAFELADFAAAIDLVDRVAQDAEEMDHHPDIDIRWSTVRFALSTHSAGGLTQLDIELAHRISAGAGRQG